MSANEYTLRAARAPRGCAREVARALEDVDLLALPSAAGPGDGRH